MNRQIINRRYRVEQRIGEGATAEAFLGFDIVLNRRVAIKTLRSQHSANRAFRLRFEREAQSAARFSHPNIISIFDVGEDHGLPYIILEYIDGQTLREIIQEEGPFHPDDVAVLVEQVAAGLALFLKNHGAAVDAALGVAAEAEVPFDLDRSFEELATSRYWDNTKAWTKAF